MSRQKWQKRHLSAGFVTGTAAVVGSLLQRRERRLSLCNLMVEPSRAPVAKALLTPLGRAFARHKVRRNSMPARAILVAFVFAVSSPAFADCREPETGTKNIPVFSPPLGEIVIGAGRLQFYSAPNANCAMAGVFVIPKDELIAYARSNDGWSSVMYSSPKTGNNVSGWVKSSRLKETGTVGH
jgi:hypothetical protein